MTDDSEAQALSAKEFAAQLRQMIVNIKGSGSEVINSDSLITYLDDVIKSRSAVVSQTEFEQYKSQLQLNVAHYNATANTSLELFRSVITAGQSAMRASFLLNGGASIALLAFIGKLTETQEDKIAVFTGSLIPFVIGVLVITMTSGITYLSQWFYGDEAKGSLRAGFVLNIVAILLGLSSYGFFIWGMSRAYYGFLAF